MERRYAHEKSHRSGGESRTAAESVQDCLGNVEPQGKFIIIDSVETFLKTLTTKRWEILRVLQKNGPMGFHPLPRLLELNFKNVYSDVKALKEIGLIEDHE